MTGTHDDLLAAYERLHRLGPEYGGDEEGNHSNANHGPMATEVMVRRGLDIPVHAWLDTYVTRLSDLPSGGDRIDEPAWREALGDRARLPAWTDYFGEQLRRAAWHDVLTTWWPRLLPGIAAGSTHGAIRVGHAVRTLQVTDHPHALDELAHGLAFWAARWRPLAPGSGTGTLEPSQALSALPRLPDQTGFLAQRLCRLDRFAAWSPAAGSLKLPTDPDDVRRTLAGLVDAATVRYLAIGRDAPVLLVHTATAPNAVLHCLPVLPRELWRPSLAAVWAAPAAITIVYAGPGGPIEPRTLSGHGHAANALDRAAQHRDEHVIKFADTAVEAYARTNDPLMLAAVHLAADLIPTNN